MVCDKEKDMYMGTVDEIVYDIETQKYSFILPA